MHLLTYAFLSNHMKRVFLTFLSCCLLLLSCGSEETTSGIGIVSIDPTETVPINDMFASVKVVPLEQKEGAFFALLFSVIKFHDDKIYIAPRSYSREKILIYYLNGRLVKTVDNFGPGPNQLKQLMRFEITDDDHIELLTVSGHLLFRYNLRKDSVEWRKKYLGNAPWEFLKKGDTEGYYFVRGVTQADYLDPLFWVYSVDSALNDSKEYFKGKPMRPNATRMPTLYHTMQWLGDELRFLPPYSDTIFRLVDDVEIPAYKLDFGGYKKYNSQDVDRKKVDDVFFNKNGIRAINFFESGEKLTLSYRFKNGTLTVFDKLDKTIKTTEISKSLLMDNSFLLTPFYADDTKVVCTFRSKNMTAQDYVKLHFDADQIEGGLGSYAPEEEVPEIVVFKFR